MNGGHCPTAHYRVHLIERAVEEHYHTIRLTPKVREEIWAEVRRDTDERAPIVQKDIERHHRQIEDYEANQARLVQFSYQGLVADEVFAREQTRLETERNKARKLLEKAELHASEIDASLDDALAKTMTPHATYPLERRLLNQTFFKRILVGEDSYSERPSLPSTPRWQAGTTASASPSPTRAPRPPSRPTWGQNAKTLAPFFRARVHTSNLWWTGAVAGRT